MREHAAHSERGDEELVVACRAGERAAFGVLVQRWFDRCWNVAWRILYDRDLASDTAQDALLAAWEGIDRLDTPAAFGGWILRIARNRALDRLDKERRAVPTADEGALEPGPESNTLADPEAELTRAQQHDLVWAASAALGERDASLLDLHLRHGMEPNELAAELGVAPNAAHQALFRMRKRLGGAVRAWLLWRDGSPGCVALRAELAAAGIERFTAETARLIDRHAGDCAECSDQRERVSAPSALFSAVPLLAVPLATRAAAVRELAASGVPTGDAAPGTVELPAAAPDGDPGAPGDVRGLGTAAGTSTASAWGRPAFWAVATFLLVVAGLGGWLLWGGAGEAPIAGRPMPEAGVVQETDRATTTPRPPESEVPTEPAPPERREPTREAPTRDTPTRQAPTQPPTEVPETAQPEPAPEVVSFDVESSQQQCRRGYDQAQQPLYGLVHRLSWESTRADAATLTVDDADPVDVAVTGTRQECAPADATFTLEITGPGGTDTATRTASEG
ncbi:sigma-70 family RNA polymerase sigma factor [Haloechinothrix sp. YIM 98757]|uniref:Sigma-70 family RNA polymerase sigma factor n=1 Tax=Haloechinothrix aidingensis TaxID=2752311 RepID=A0A837ZXY1_9PSEU|nr:sigma-70 family RNA polymerase sigma factor [Haloechinothrix aidingensis]MBA0125496.1 sigma-70 family RNA polymerase sigma factor [Haloechinothrix aidingensis]